MTNSDLDFLVDVEPILYFLSLTYDFFEVMDKPSSFAKASDGHGGMSLQTNNYKLITYFPHCRMISYRTIPVVVATFSEFARPSIGTSSVISDNF